MGALIEGGGNALLSEADWRKIRPIILGQQPEKGFGVSAAARVLKTTPARIEEFFRWARGDIEGADWLHDVREALRLRRSIVLESLDDRMYQLAMKGDRDTLYDEDGNVIKVHVRERMADVMKARDRIANNTQADDEGAEPEGDLTTRIGRAYKLWEAEQRRTDQAVEANVSE